MRVGYRLGQFGQLIHASRLPPEAWREIESLLSPAELALFRRFSNADRQHSYRVMRRVRAAGGEEPDLLVAALLHDVGKTRVRIRLWERVLGAIGERFFPRRVRTWGRGSASGWRRPFAIRVQHAQWGAEMAEAAGATPQAVYLIRHHQDKELDLPDARMARLLRTLQWADDQL